MDEDVEDYLLRHTRMIPRDVVSLGNNLCEQILLAKSNGDKALREEVIRDTVASASKRFGDSQIAQCANQ